MLVCRGETKSLGDDTKVRQTILVGHAVHDSYLRAREKRRLYGRSVVAAPPPTTILIAEKGAAALLWHYDVQEIRMCYISRSDGASRNTHEHINGVKESQAQVPAQLLEVDTCMPRAQLSTLGDVVNFGGHTQNAHSCT